jgi:predicted kinase
MKFKQYINESINDKGILKACFMAGQPGAGKTFVINKITGGSVQPKVINTDTWAEFYKAYGDKEWDKYGNKIKTLTKNQLSLYLNSMLPLWVDGTSSLPNAVVRRRGIVESIGYDTAFIWVDTSLETAIERQQLRDRKVNPDEITKIYNNIQPLKDYYKHHFRNFIVIDNNKGEFTDSVVLGAYRKMSGWFTEPLKNPIGTMLVDRMTEKGDKYLTDSEYTMPQLKNLVEGWYRH